MRAGRPAAPASLRFRAAAGGHRWVALHAGAALPDGGALLVGRDETAKSNARRRAAAIEAQSGVGSWSVDLDTSALVWSARTFAIHEFDPAGGPPPLARALDFYTADARAVLERAVAALFAEGRGYALDLRLRMARGALRWVHTTATAEMRDGRPVRVFGTIQDVTEPLAARQRLDDILRGADVGTWEWNVRTGETRFNARWAEIVGRDLAELHPTTIETWLRLVHPDDLPASSAALAAHFAGETEISRCEARMRHRDGGDVWVLDVGRVSSRGEDGAPEWMAGAHIDITAFKRQEAALEAARA